MYSFSLETRPASLLGVCLSFSTFKKEKNYILQAKSKDIQQGHCYNEKNSIRKMIQILVIYVIAY